jgi:hypothetical protein
MAIVGEALLQLGITRRLILEQDLCRLEIGQPFGEPFEVVLVLGCHDIDLVRFDDVQTRVREVKCAKQHDFGRLLRTACCRDQCQKDAENSKGIFHV